MNTTLNRKTSRTAAEQLASAHVSAPAIEMGIPAPQPAIEMGLPRVRSIGPRRPRPPFDDGPGAPGGIAVAA
jgi:hypothetical protein